MARRCCDRHARQARPTGVAKVAKKRVTDQEWQLYTYCLCLIYKTFILNYTIVILLLPAPDR